MVNQKQEVLKVEHHICWISTINVPAVRDRKVLRRLYNLPQFRIHFRILKSRNKKNGLYKKGENIMQSPNEINI